MSGRRAATSALVALAVAAAAGCGRGTTHPVVPGASTSRGHALIEFYGCGACHVIGGIATADGHVGPSLETFPGRQTIAGTLPNTAENLIDWIEHPQKVVPGSDMPDLGVTAAQAKDIAAYLYSQ